MAINWDKQVKESIKRLEALKPEDRLQTVASIRECWLAVNSSQLGWAQWLANVKVLNLLPEDLLNHFLDVFRKCAVAFLKFDIAATNAVNPFLQAERKRKVGKEKSREKSSMIS